MKIAELVEALDQDTKQQIKLLYARGEPLSAISKRCNCSTSGIYWIVSHDPKFAELQAQRKTVKPGGFKRYRIDPSDAEELTTLYIQGKPLDYIAQEFGVNFDTINRYISQLPNYSEVKQQRASNLKYPLLGVRKNLSADQIQQIADLRNQGLTLDQIALQLGTSRPTIARQLRKININ